MHQDRQAVVPPVERYISAFLRKQLKPAALGVASLSFFGAEGGGVYAQTGAKPEPTLPEVRVQESPDTGFRVDTTRGATRTDTPLRDIPQTINIVPQSLIRSQGATTLQQALRNVPGISYGAAEGGTQANQVFFLRTLCSMTSSPRAPNSSLLLTLAGVAGDTGLRGAIGPGAVFCSSINK